MEKVKELTTLPLTSEFLESTEIKQPPKVLIHKQKHIDMYGLKQQPEREGNLNLFVINISHSPKINKFICQWYPISLPPLLSPSALPFLPSTAAQTVHSDAACC